MSKPQRELATLPFGSPVAVIGGVQVFMTTWGNAGLRLRHFYDGHPAGVVTKEDLPALIIALQALHAVMPDEETELTAKDGEVVYCVDCGEPQFETPSGICCKNGHGGADGDPDLHKTRYWHHPESGSVFITEPGERRPADGLVEEIDKDAYARLLIEYSDDDPFAII